ncbi:MAG: hypothetical protein D6725_10005 [Planctomycetota bacterium]|nr:MAG: hypothetical protein D6725_10005 [Planctomycetota bacterium]
MRSAVDVTKTHVAAEFNVGSPLISCRYHPTGQYIFAGAQDYRVWRVDTKGNKTPFVADAWVRGIAFTEQGRVLLTGGYDGRLSWWDALGDGKQPLRSVDAHQGWIRAVAVSADGKLAATAGNDLVVRLWSVNDGKLVRELSGHQSHVYNVAFHPHQARLVSGDLKAELFDWDVTTGVRQRHWQIKALYKYDGGFRADIGGTRTMRFDAEGKRLAVGGITNVTNAFAGVGNPLVVVVDWTSGKQQEYHSKSKPRGVAWGVAFLADGTIVACSGGGSGGLLLFWQPGKKDAFHETKLPNTARDLDLAPDGQHVVTAHYDGRLRVSKLGPKS